MEQTKLSGITIGSCVKWSSVASGIKKEKIGVVVGILEKGDSLDMCFKNNNLHTENFSLQFDYWPTCRVGIRRYLVSVASPGKGKPKLYFPRTSPIEVPVKCYF
jgi:hypothetical protein